MKALSWLLLVLQCGVVVGCWAWNHVHHPMGNQLAGGLVEQALAYGRLAGLLLAFGSLFQILLASRIRWLDRAFGLDRATRLHHVLGFVLLVTLLAHPALVLIGHAAQAGVTLREQQIDFLRQWDDVAAASAGWAVMLAALGFSVLVALRRLGYEFWRATHLSLYVAVALAFGHQLAVGGDFTAGPSWFRFYWMALYAFVALNVVAYRLVFPLLAFQRHRFAVAGVQPETPDVNSVRIGGRHLQALGIRAGQFVIVRFLARGFRWESHPFSISRLPDGDSFRLTIKALGDFTRRIPALCAGTPVIVEGPFGVFTSERCRSAKVLFVAGGIGITPIRALAGEMAGQGRDMVLLYANRRSAAVFDRELRDLAAATGLLRIVPVVSAEPGWQGEKGAIDRDRIARLVPDVVDRDVYLCGPPAMMKGVRRALASLGVPGSRIHWERFAL